MIIAPPPECLINDLGHPNFGVFAAPIPRLNAQDFIPPGQKKPLPAGQLKRWLYFGLTNESVIAGGAMVSLGLLGKVFFYVFNRKNNKLSEFSATLPFNRGLRITSNGLEGSALFTRGQERFEIVSSPGAQHCQVKLGGIELEATLQGKSPPLACITRVGYRGFNYTLKHAGLPCSGKLMVNGVEHSLAASLAVIDLTVGKLARETFWNWAAGGGLDADGHIIGINLVAGINETSFTENAFWIDHQMVKVDTVHFVYDADNVLAPWHIFSCDGRVDLTFKPAGERAENINLHWLASKFHQLFGEFSGVLTGDQDAYKVQSMGGFTEEHYARW